MILRRLTADFGRLSGDTLELTPGLNVIEAPNESGKSTWCAFLRVMLYGPGGRSGKGGPRSDRELYAPWDGSPMQGSVELLWQGRDVTLRRSSEGAAGPMRSFSAVYTGTNRPVAGLTESDAGERLTGLSADVFRRTAFIGQEGLRVVPGPELERYITAAVASGEAGVSYTEAAARLRSWQRRYRYRNQGRLPDQEAELKKLDGDLEALSRITAQLEEAERREQRASAAYSELADRIGTAERESRRARQELLDREAERRRREREAEALRASLADSPLAGQRPDETFRRRARADSRRCAELLRQTRDAPTALYWALCLALALLCGAAGLVNRLFFLPFAALLAAGGVLLTRYLRAVKRRARLTTELETLREHYGARTPRAILAAAEDYAGRYREMLSLTAAAGELSAQTGEETARGAETPLAETLSSAGEELRELAAQKARLLAERESLGDRETMEERRDALKSAHERDERTSRALEIALAELAAADEEMHTRFAPELSRRTERIFRVLTGGQGDQLLLDRDLTAAVQRTDERTPHADACLSRGTRDQLWLALRLALCEEARECPIILDDALVTFDDERLGRAMEVLREIARTRQVLVFTCQRRERAYLEEKQAQSQN